MIIVALGIVYVVVGLDATSPSAWSCDDLPADGVSKLALLRRRRSCSARSSALGAASRDCASTPPGAGRLRLPRTAAARPRQRPRLGRREPRRAVRHRSPARRRRPAVGRSSTAAVTGDLRRVADDARRRCSASPGWSLLITATGIGGDVKVGASLRRSWSRTVFWSFGSWSTPRLGAARATRSSRRRTRCCSARCWLLALSLRSAVSTWSRRRPRLEAWLRLGVPGDVRLGRGLHGVRLGAQRRRRSRWSRPMRTSTPWSLVFLGLADPVGAGHASRSSLGGGIVVVAVAIVRGGRAPDSSQDRAVAGPSLASRSRSSHSCEAAANARRRDRLAPPASSRDGACGRS